MNKHCYRIIFSKARGTWMAVAEIVRPCGRSASSVVNADGSRRKGKPLAVTLRPVTFALLTLMGMITIPLTPVHADCRPRGISPCRPAKIPPPVPPN